MIWLKIITAAVLSGSLFAVVEAVLPPRPPQPFTIQVSDWPGDQLFALIEPLGLDAGLPVHFDIRRTPASRDPVQAFRDGLVDAVMIGLDRLPDVLPDEVRVIYVVDEMVGEARLVAGPGVGSAAALRGRKIGVAYDGAAGPLALSLLDQAGVDPHTVTLVSLSSDDLLPALRSGRVAAVTAISPTRLTLLQQLPGTTVLASTQTGADLVTHVLVVREGRIPEQRDRLVAVVHALSDAVGTCRKAQDRCLELMAAISGRPVEAWRQDFEAVQLLDLADNVALLGDDADAPIARRLAAVEALPGRHHARSASAPATPSPPWPSSNWIDPSLVQEEARP